jgi:hypothetical protein
MNPISCNFALGMITRLRRFPERNRDRSGFQPFRTLFGPVPENFTAQADQTESPHESQGRMPSKRDLATQYDQLNGKTGKLNPAEQTCF